MSIAYACIYGNLCCYLNYFKFQSLKRSDPPIMSFSVVHRMENKHRTQPWATKLNISRRNPRESDIFRGIIWGCLLNLFLSFSIWLFPFWLLHFNTVPCLIVSRCHEPRGVSSWEMHVWMSYVMHGASNYRKFTFVWDMLCIERQIIENSRLYEICYAWSVKSWKMHVWVSYLMP